MSSTKTQLERVQLTDTQIKLEMPEKVLNQIKYLCREIPKVEWSGILFYRVEGSIKDPTNMKFILEDILPMHKGTAAYTEYTIDATVIEHMEENEHLEECKIGHIHSHNTMAVFFSGTDWSELEDNAPNHNFYLSLIVNNFMDFCAKVCFISQAQEEQEFSFYAKDEEGKKYVSSKHSFGVNTKKLVVYDCDIITPDKGIDIDDAFKGKVETIIKKALYVAPVRTSTWATGQAALANMGPASAKKTPTSPTWQKQNNWGADWGGTFEDESDWGIPPGKTNNQKNLEDTEVIEFELDIENFAMIVLNTGNPVAEFSDCEDIIDYYETYNLSPTALKKGVLENYKQVYDTHVAAKDPEANNEDAFMVVTESIVAEYLNAANLILSLSGRKMLYSVVDGLNELIEALNKTK
jgi:hypothetical protein